MAVVDGLAKTTPPPKGGRNPRRNASTDWTKSVRPRRRLVLLLLLLLLSFVEVVVVVVVVDTVAV